MLTLFKQISGEDTQSNKKSIGTTNQRKNVPVEPMVVESNHQQ